MDGKMALSRMLLFELCKIMVKKVTFVGFTEGDRPNSPPGSAPDST